MFDNKRYLTRGIASKVPLTIQLLIWQMIDKLRDKRSKVDYLQVFKVKHSDRHIIIEQSVVNLCLKILLNFIRQVWEQRKQDKCTLFGSWMTESIH